MTVEQLDILEGLVDSLGPYGDYLFAILGVISAMSGFAAITPSTTDNRFWNIAAKLVNILALNVFKAKNADDVPKQNELRANS